MASLGSTATVRWNVANTNNAPVDVDMIEFYLSTDGGATFAATPFDSRANVGYARVTFPSGIQTSAARLMIRGENNIFYDVSNANFTLDSDAAATPETPTRGLGAWCQQMAARNSILAMVMVRSPRALRISFKSAQACAG